MLKIVIVLVILLFSGCVRALDKNEYDSPKSGEIKPTIVFSDDFSDVSYSQEHWIPSGGTWEFKNDVCSISLDRGYVWSLTGDNKWDNYSVNVDFKVDSPGFLGGVVFRAYDMGNFYVVIISDGGLFLWKLINGSSWVKVDEVIQNMNTTVDEWHNVSVKAIHDSISVSVNGRLILETSDSTFSRGKVGLYASASNNSGQVNYDNIVVYDIGMTKKDTTPESFRVRPRINTPYEDTIVTTLRPHIHFFNASGGEGTVSYVIQIDTSPLFDSSDLIEYRDIVEDQLVTGYRIEKGDELKDRSKYWYRVMAVDEAGQTTNWVVSRFYLDTKSDEHHEGLYRIPVTKASGTGYNHNNLIKLVDNGTNTFWTGNKSEGEVEKIIFDLGDIHTVSRIWILGDKNITHGRPRNYVWEYSNDLKTWSEMEETKISDSDAFRRIIDLEQTVEARYMRLKITEWHGQRASLAEICFYGPGSPSSLKNIEKPIENPYVIIVDLGYSGQSGRSAFVAYMNRYIQKTGHDWDVVSVPYYEFSTRWIELAGKNPVAILYSGFFRWYEDIPMFEFNGLFEAVRCGNIPVFGACGGHQIMAMSYGYTLCREMGTESRHPLSIEVTKDDTIFESLGNSFEAVKSHAWEVIDAPEFYETLAFSYVPFAHGKKELIEVIKFPTGLVYGTQFHGENRSAEQYLQAVRVVDNFLDMAWENYLEK